MWILSNKDEAKNLADSEYQLKLAVLIYNGIMKYISGTNDEDVEIIDSANSLSGV